MEINNIEENLNILSDLSNSTNEDINLLRTKFSNLFQENLILKDENARIKNDFLEIEKSINNDIDGIDEVSKSCCYPSKNEIKIIYENNSKDPFIILDDLINLINNIKTELLKLNDLTCGYENLVNSKNQDSDDLLFYKSMISDSKNFYYPSFKIRKKKLINDLNKIIKMFNYSDVRLIHTLDHNLVKNIKDIYIRLLQEIKNSQVNLKTKWIKDNKNKCSETIKKELLRTFSYHLDINNHFYNSIKNEVEFYSLEI
tara:strand:+ start:430 stop:1200 length:771 start_codon:yes stop_codon:yes gene_type:complete